jgi:ACS family tartrate transporter-like MFS transporter
MLQKRAEDWSKSEIGILLALPPLCAVVVMTLWGTHSDRTGERRIHLTLAALFAAAGWTLVACTRSPWPCLLGFCIALSGMMSILPVFWAMPTSFLSGVAAAGGIALINSLGNVGAVFGAFILGRYGPWALVGILCVCGILGLAIRHDASLERADHPA